MRNVQTDPRSATALVGAECWKKLGVQGARPCDELRRHVHCRNCPVFSAAAQMLLDRAPQEEYIAERTLHFARPMHVESREGRPALIFRLDVEWFAVQTDVVQEV